VTNRTQKHLRSGQRGHDDAAAAPEVTTAREQETRVNGEPETRTLREKGKRPQITLRNGAIVDARRAVAIVERLQTTLATQPDEFRSLLALAQALPQNADPQHFEELWALAFLENDHSIDPMVRDVLLNCYQVTTEGPVVVPLRLQNEADLPAAKHAQRQRDQRLRNIVRKPKSDEGPSRE
jgi:hypothetical protein